MKGTRDRRDLRQKGVETENGQDGRESGWKGVMVEGSLDR